MSNDWDYFYGVGNWRSRLITLKQSKRWKFLRSCNTLAPLSSRNNNLSCTTPSEQRRLHSWLIYTFPLQSCNFQTNLNKFLDWSHKSFDDLRYNNNNRQKHFKPAELIWWLDTKSCSVQIAFARTQKVLYIKACKFRPRALKPGLLYTFFHESWPGVCVSVGRLIFVRAISTNHPQCQLQDWEAGYRFSIHCCCKVCFAPQTLRSASKLRLRACWPHEKNKALNR